MREEAAQLEGGTLVGAEADATREGRPVDALAPPLGEPTRSQRRLKHLLRLRRPLRRCRHWLRRRLPRPERGRGACMRSTQGRVRDLEAQLTRHWLRDHRTERGARQSTHRPRQGRPRDQADLAGAQSHHDIVLRLGRSPGEWHPARPTACTLLVRVGSYQVGEVHRGRAERLVRGRYLLIEDGQGQLRAGWVLDVEADHLILGPRIPALLGSALGAAKEVGEPLLGLLGHRLAPHRRRARAVDGAPQPDRALLRTLLILLIHREDHIRIACAAAHERLGEVLPFRELLRFA